MMKFPLILSFLLIPILVFSQDSYILNKDGSRIVLVKNSVEVVVNDKLISYQVLGSNSTKKLAFNNIHEVYFSNYKLKYFKLKNSKIPSCMFVLSESDKYTLAFIGNPDLDSLEDELDVKIKYRLFVLDKDNNILEEHSFNNINSTSNANDRSLIFDKIKYYFKDCDNLSRRIYDYEMLNEANFMGMIGFFKFPVYVSCKS